MTTAPSLDDGPGAPFDPTVLLPGLQQLGRASRHASQRLAAELDVLAALARQVPRRNGDERGATEWTSFVREVAVARRCSDRAAATDITHAVQLARMPVTRDLLRSGDLPVAQLRALVEETWPAGPAALAAVDAEVGRRAVTLAPARVRDAVRKVLLREEADLTAVRAARAVADRHVRRRPLADDQAEIVLSGPAVPVAQAYEALDAEARSLRAAGDGRTLDALRFDLAAERLCTSVARAAASPSEAAAGAVSTTAAGVADTGATDAAPVAAPGAPAAATGEPAWLHDRRCSRPVRLDVQVPVTTLLGLSNEPGWLEGHGWISAPTCRQLLVSAELRRLVVDEETGRLLDLSPTVERPDLSPAAVARALQHMASDPFDITDVTWREEPRHDPSPPLREFVALRDVLCDGPTGARGSARSAHQDHDVPYPDGPTAAWNLVARGERVHLLKHRGWTPVRTPTSTLWFSPAGQLVEVPHSHQPLHPVDPEARVPDPDDLAQLDTELLRPPTLDDDPPDW